MLLAALVHVAVVCPLLCTLHEQCVVAADCIVVVVEAACGCELLCLRVQSATIVFTATIGDDCIHDDSSCCKTSTLRFN